MGLLDLFKKKKQEFLNSRDYDYFNNKYIDYLVADLDTKSPSTNISQYSYQATNNINSNYNKLNETIAKIDAMREEIREDELGKTHGMLRLLGIEKYINLSFSEFKQLPKEELDKLVEIQKTSEEIIKNNPEESTDTLYNYVCNEIAQFEKLYIDQEMAQSEELNNEVNKSR